MDFVSKIHEIECLMEKHSAFRDDCLNLIASENTPSPLVERLLSEELNRRYGYYTGIDLHQRAYRGNCFIVQIEEAAHELAKQLFGAAYVDLRPLSGNIAGIAATFALGSPGDTVLEVYNAHRYAHKLASSFLKVELQSISIPWVGPTYNIDLIGRFLSSNSIDLNSSSLGPRYFFFLNRYWNSKRRCANTVRTHT